MSTKTIMLMASLIQLLVIAVVEGMASNISQIDLETNVDQFDVDRGFLETTSLQDDAFSEEENETRNLTELMELELSEYPLRDPLSIAIPMTCIYSLILLSGLIGNISTCIIIARTSYMHTATNYYLFSLAMSDLLLLISGVPQEIYHIWIKYPYIFGEAFCVIRGLAAETSANATVLTITAFTVERFAAIVYPLKSHLLSQLSRVVRMIAIIWIVAFCLALPQAAQFGVLDSMSRHDPSVVLIKGAWCTLVREIFPYAFQISICVFFAIPMTIITVLYVLIGLKLRRSRKGPLNHRGSQDLNVEPRTQNRHSQSHVVRMLVAVVVGFFICWAPFHAQRLMALYGASVGRDTLPTIFLTIYKGLTHISGILYYISTCINPILYHIMSNKFRQAFKDTMSQLCGNDPSPHLHHRNYSAMSHRSARLGVLHHYKSNSRNSLMTSNSNQNLNQNRGGNGATNGDGGRGELILSTIEESEKYHHNENSHHNQNQNNHNNSTTMVKSKSACSSNSEATMTSSASGGGGGGGSGGRKGPKIHLEELGDFTINVNEEIRAETEIVLPMKRESPTKKKKGVGIGFRNHK